MRTTVVNIHHGEAKYGPDRVYCGRGSPFGNPFVIGVDGTRDDVCDKYGPYIVARLRKEPKLREALRRLRGKKLVCFCAPKRCHCDFLATLAEYGLPPEDDGEDESENEEEDL